MSVNQIAGTIVWNLDVDDSKFNAALDKSKAAAQNLGKQINQEFGGIQSKVTNAFDSATKASNLFATGLLAVGAATITAAGFGVKYAADLESMRAGFITLLGSAKLADEAIAQIQKDAAATPFNFSGLVSANQLLTSVTKNSSVSERFLLNIGKALTAMGKGQPELDRIIVNLQQIGAIGHANAIDLKQFAFAGIPIYDLLNEKIKGTGKNIEDMTANGEITFALLQDLFNQAGEGAGRFARAFKEQGGTMNQVWSNFQDNLGITASAIVKQTGLFDALKVALNQATNALGFLASPAGMGKIMQFLGFLRDNLPVVIGLILGGLAPALRSLAIKSLIPLAISFAHLIPFIAIGAAIGFAIKLIIDSLGGWDGAVKKFNSGVDFLKGKVAPLVPFFKFTFDRIGQIVSGLGISGQFGGLRNSFVGLAEGAQFWTARTLQILGDYWQKAKNFLAFGTTGGNATIADALQGIVNRLKPLMQTLDPLFEKVSANLALTGQIIQTQVKPAFDALVQASGPLLKALEPFLKDFIKNAFVGLAIAIGAVISTILAVITGLVTGVANALPYVAQAFEGLVQFIRGVVQIITALLTGDLSLAWEGVKQAAVGAFEFFYNGFTAILKFISGFVQGVVTFFVGLYNALVGHSIIPDMVNAIVEWFTGLPTRIYNALVIIVTQIPQLFKDAWDSVTNVVSTWATDVYNWGVNIAKSFADGFSQLGQWLKDKINAGLNDAKKFLQGKSPPIAGPFQNIDLWGKNVGMAWVQGLESAINSVSFDNPMLAQMPAVAPAPAIASGAGRGRIDKLVNIESMQVRDDSDITDIARELGFRIENSTGFTQ